MRRIKLGSCFIRLTHFKRENVKHRFKITTYETDYVLKAISFWFFKFKLTIGIKK